MIGLLGGTFDPIHQGHLDVAHAAQRALALDVVWLIPAHVPPHRGTPQASAAHRFAMVALAVADQPSLRVSDLEMDTPGPSYTIDTLDRLVARGIDPLRTCLILGADAFREIPSWKAFPGLLDRCHVAVVSRPGAPVEDLRAQLPDLAPRMQAARQPVAGTPRIHLIDADTTAISSTDLRRALAGGAPPDDCLPAAVTAHIRRHHLYESLDSVNLTKEPA